MVVVDDELTVDAVVVLAVVVVVATEAKDTVVDVTVEAEVDVDETVDGPKVPPKLKLGAAEGVASPKLKPVVLDGFSVEKSDVEIEVFVSFAD